MTERGLMGHTDTRLPLPDAIRGVAALAVALHHFGSGLPLPTGVAQVTNWGWLGVEAFFVLSGFVIAGLLLRGPVRADAFVWRRLVRLMPPYLAVVGMVIALDFASSLAPAFRGPGWAFPSPATLACHLTYACDLIGLKWNNPVFWTLAIEVQFYVVAVLIAGIVRRGAVPFRVLAICAVSALALVAPPAWFERFVPLFALGASAACWCTERVHRSLRYVLLPASIAWALWQLDAAPAAVGVCVALVIAVAAHRTVPRALIGLGTLSYSLYLVHAPIGGRVVNLLDRLQPGPWAALGIVGVALLLSLAAAWALWRWVERPALAASRRIADREPAPGTRAAAESA